MSHADHEWARENLQAHLAGGLPADERARLEAHLAVCAECIAEIDATRRFERSMDDLFAPVRPKPGLEERVIRQLRLTNGLAPPRVRAGRVPLQSKRLRAVGMPKQQRLDLRARLLQGAPGQPAADRLHHGVERRLPLIDGAQGRRHPEIRGRTGRHVLQPGAGPAPAA